MRENFKQMVILSILYAISLALQIAIIGISGSTYSYYNFALIILLICGLIPLIIAHLVETIFLSYLETENAVRDLRTTHYIGWLICLIAGIVGCIGPPFPQILAPILSLLITGGMIICGIYLFPLIGEEKGFKPPASPKAAIPSLEILKQRLAKGEINKEKFLELKQLLED